MLLTTTASERIDLCAKMRRFRGRSNGPESFVHTRYSADFTIITSEFEFSVHTGIARSLARKRVTVIDYPDGRLTIRYNGVDLPYRTFDKRPQVNQAAIVENKRLGPILAYIAEQQKKLDMSRSAKAPRRRGQKNHMFKVG